MAARRPHSGDRLRCRGDGLRWRSARDRGDRAPEWWRRRLAARHSQREALRNAPRGRGQLRRDRSRRAHALLPRPRHRTHRQRDQGDVPGGLPAPGLGPSSRSAPRRSPPAGPHDPALGQRRGDASQGHRRPQRDRTGGPRRGHARLQLRPGVGPEQDQRPRPGALHVPPRALHPEAPPPLRPPSALQHRPVAALGHRRGASRRAGSSTSRAAGGAAPAASTTRSPSWRSTAGASRSRS